MEARKYLVILEHAEGSNFSAYVPDLPGCVSTGDTRQECLRNIREAIALHIEGMREDGLPIPEPSSEADYVAAVA
ncbi:MAG: type II toxin-antitoxin system HicB family antitoxin [Planctomycetes bacterium]|jgi:predicted RNase H-like HicB family nuclease|nr:type II toxin-antitoxin system HicB family antitoxin [Planctomycetota bacterium]